MKKLSILLALTVLVVLATAGSAFANFGPHGAYSLDTDACAGCHRAHTSFSTLTWNDGVDDRSALLVSSASSMTEFCYACHGDAAPGASTNVEVGRFDSGPSGADGVPLGGAIMYQTNSSFDATLNGGAFSGVTSMHDMDKGAVTDPMWGAGTSAPAGTDLSCTSCHDVHGSSNYRLLKDSVNGNTVGGYDASDNPRGYVFSSEEGYPTADDGWFKHEAGAAQMTTYRPNYTEAQYLFASGTGGYATSFRSMSTWCSACHEEYDNLSSSYDYGVYESNGSITRDGNGQLQVAGATQQVGALVRHRHPVNTTVGSANTINGFATNAVTSTVLPLEKTVASAGDPVGAYRLTDYMGCLTCHRAHGTDAEMTGWANSRLVYNNPASAVNTWSVEPTTVAPAGVNPNVSAALLRTDNRGVCERCHNK